MTNAWELIRSGQYEAAAEEYGRLVREQGGRFNLANLGVAHLLMGNFPAALDDFQRIIAESDPRYLSTSEYVSAGIALWNLDRPEEAIASWRAGLAAPYTDAAGGVEIPALLLYGGWRSGSPAVEKEGVKLLEKLWAGHLRRQKRRQERARPTHSDLVHPGLVAWPGAIVPFLLGEIDQAGLQRAVEQAGNDTLRERWQCAAHFHLAVGAGRMNDPASFREGMRRCAASRGELESEFYLARWEVERGFPQPAFETA